MGKREILLIAAFLVVGVVAWRLTAPPPAPGQEGFSLARAWRSVRTAVQSDAARATATRGERVRVEATVNRVVVAEFRGELSVVGADGAELAAELTATLSGPDDAEAQRLAQEVRLQLEPDGGDLRVRVILPDVRRPPDLSLRLRVPRRLLVRLSVQARRLEVREVAGLELDVRRGSVTVTGVAGALLGEQRDGELEVSEVGSARLVLRRVDARLARIDGTAIIEATDGDLTVRETGRLELQARRVDVEVERVRGEAQVAGTDGQVDMREAGGRLRFEGRRCPLQLNPVPEAGADVSSEGARVELRLPPSGATLDLVASGGEIRVPEGTLRVDRREEVSRATGAVGTGGPSVRVRTTSGDIIVRR